MVYMIDLKLEFLPIIWKCMTEIKGNCYHSESNTITSIARLKKTKSKLSCSKHTFTLFQMWLGSIHKT